MLTFVSSENTTRRQSSVVQFWYFLAHASRLFMCFVINNGFLTLIAEKKFIDFNTFIAVLYDMEYPSSMSLSCTSFVVLSYPCAT